MGASFGFPQFWTVPGCTRAPSGGQVGEVYALPDEELGLAFRTIMEGVALIWLDGGAADPEELRRIGMTAVDVVVRAADPRPAGPPSR